MTWISFKYSAKKAWLLFKKYGWLIAIALVAVFILATRKDGWQLIQKFVSAGDDRYDGARKVLEEAQQKEIQRTVDYHKLETELAEKYNIRRSEAKKQMEAAIKENNEKSIEELAAEIAKALGAEVKPPAG